MKRGAYVKAPASVSEASALWLAADTKGFYTMLDPPARAALASVGAEPLDLVAGPPAASAEKTHHSSQSLLGSFLTFLRLGPALPHSARPWPPEVSAQALISIARFPRISTCCAWTPMTGCSL